MPERQPLPPTHPLAKFQRQWSVPNVKKPDFVEHMATENNQPVVRQERLPDTIDRGDYRHRYNALVKAIRNHQQTEQSPLDDGWC